MTPTNSTIGQSILAAGVVPGAAEAYGMSRLSALLLDGLPIRSFLTELCAIIGSSDAGCLRSSQATHRELGSPTSRILSCLPVP